MPREQSKCREWEKERRERLNEAFSALSKLLPSYDPAITVNKVDILKNAAQYIKDLQEKMEKLIVNEETADKVKGDEIKRLQERIKKLLSKNEQLCDLLREAKITIPKNCCYIKIKSNQKWSNKITKEQAKAVQKNEQEKENTEKNVKKIVNKNKNGTGTPKHRKVIVNRNQKQLKLNKRKKVKNIPSTKCVIVLSQSSMTQPCYVIANTPSNGLLGNASTVITNSNLLTNPLVSSDTKTYKPVSAVSQLGPGTLILPNGAILPVLPQQTVVPVNSQIISNSLPLANKPTTPTVILVSSQKIPTTTTTTTVSIKSNISTASKPLQRVKPKYCLTKTTQVNKVPIPALTSRYANNDLVLNKNVTKVVKKTICNKKIDNKNDENKKPEVREKRKSPPTNYKEMPKQVRLEKTKDDEQQTNETKASSSKQSKVEEKDNDQESSSKNNIESEDAILREKSDNIGKNSEKLAIIEEKRSDCPTIEEKGTICEKTVEVVPNIIEKSNENQQEQEQSAQHPQEKQHEQQQQQSQDMKTLELNINHSELSNDIFATLQVPTGCQNPESTSPTAAFLLAFPLVSSLTGVKVTEVPEEETSESQRGTPTLLQIGTMETTKRTQSESLTPSLLNLDNLSFFSSKDICGNFYNSFDTPITSTITSSSVNTTIATSTPVTISTTVHNQPEKMSLKNNFENDHRQKTNNNNTECNLSHFEQNNIINDTNLYIKSKPNKVEQQQPQSHQPNQQQQSQQKNCINYNTQGCNETFNDLTKISTTFSYSSVIKNYPDPLYTNTSTYGYNYPENNLNQSYYKNISKSDNRSYYSLNYENYSDYRKNESTNSHLTPNYYNSQCPSNMKVVNTTSGSTATNIGTKTKTSNRPINWMTTPDNRIQSDYVLPQFSKDGDFGHNSIYPANTQSYFNSNTTYPNSNDIGNPDLRKNLDLPLVPPVNTYQEENQFSWSPTKMPQFLEPPHSFVSSTLPTLVGDLALGNSLNFNNDQQKNQKKDNVRRVKNYESNQTNFLSVSQLVDHNKNEGPGPARTTTRRNSGNRSSKKLQHQQHQQSQSQQQQQKNHQRNKNHEAKELYSNNNKVDKNIKPINSGYNQSNTDLLYAQQQQQQSKNRVISKQSSSNYSAEALIGHQLQSSSSEKIRQHNYSSTSNKSGISVPSFLPENIIPYFPSVDLQPQDNNYIQQNQNYQTTTFGHNFATSFQNNSTYTTNTFIPPTTTTPSYNFIHDMNHDYTDNLNLFPTTTAATSSTIPTKEKCSKNLNRNTNRDQQQPNFCVALSGTTTTINNKKTKKKQSSESTNLPGFADFSFFSMPGSINSPVLPDDFHSHTGFLQPPTPQLYPCKNPLYSSKQNDLTPTSLLPLPPVPGTRSNIQHPEISPSINTAGTSLTNFNLSTIFPEINKQGALSDPYLEPRIKDHHSSRNYISTAQVPFNDKPTFSFSYSSTSQSYTNQ